MNKKTDKIYSNYKYFSYIDKASEKKINICNLNKFCVFFYSYIYIYIYIILSRINRTTTNLLLKVLRFFHNLQVVKVFRSSDRERNVKL